MLKVLKEIFFENLPKEWLPKEDLDFNKVVKKLVASDALRSPFILFNYFGYYFSS